MAQQLGVCTVLTQNLTLVLKTIIGRLKTICNSSPGEIDTSRLCSPPPQCLHHPKKYIFFFLFLRQG